MSSDDVVVDENTKTEGEGKAQDEEGSNQQQDVAGGGLPTTRPPRDSRSRVSVLRPAGGSGHDRRDYMKELLLKEKIRRRQSVIKFDGIIDEEKGEGDYDESSTLDDYADDSRLIADLTEEVEQESNELSSKLQEVLGLIKENGFDPSAALKSPLEVRMTNFGYTVSVDPQSEEITTVYTQSMIYQIVNFSKRWWKGEKVFRRERTRKTVLEDISLVLKPGKSYLCKIKTSIF